MTLTSPKKFHSKIKKNLLNQALIPLVGLEGLNELVRLLRDCLQETEDHTHRLKCESE